MAAIPSLALAERAKAANCPNQWHDDEWDGEMKRDLAAGKLDQLLSEVDADITNGELCDIPRVRK